MIVSVFVRRLREGCRSNRRRCAMYHVQAEYDFTASRDASIWPTQKACSSPCDEAPPPRRCAAQTSLLTI